MYFAIIGNHSEITLKELQIIHPKNLSKIGEHTIIFDTNEKEKLPNIASLIKRGEIFSFSEVEETLKNQGEGKRRILGIADKNLGINFKKKYKMKRFKQVDILHTDMEVKNKGIELIKFPPTRGDTPKGRGAEEYGVVQGYQNIKLYEVVDFDKPARSMQVGMMPAKLTHSLVNIATSYISNKDNILIFDPFCGTGTTGFIANALGYNFVGSDIKPSRSYNNQERRKNTEYFQTKIFEFFEQDISKTLSSSFEILKNYKTVVVTEGWLGPVIKQTTTPEEIKEYQRRVKNLYLQFIQTITDFFPKDKKPPMVFTIPFYIGQENTIEEHIKDLTEKLNRKMETIDEIYKRENQKVGRKIIILQ